MSSTETLAHELPEGDGGQPASTPLTPVGGGPPRARRKLVSDGVFAMLLFIIAEVMFFLGLMSAFTIARASAVGGIWPPLNQPRLPVAATALNTLALLLSGVVCFAAWRAFKAERNSAQKLLLGSLALGTIFVFFQGREWVGLIKQGLTMTSSQHGSFFYMIVGTHALHAVAALMAMAWCWVRLRKGRLTASAFATMQLFWMFVVGLWPLLYFRVYL